MSPQIPLWVIVLNMPNSSKYTLCQDITGLESIFLLNILQNVKVFIYISLIYTIWVACHLLIRVSCHLNSNIYYMYTYFMNYYGIFFSGLNMLYLLGMTAKLLPWREWVSVERPDQACTEYVGQGGPARWMCSTLLYNILRSLPFLRNVVPLLSSQ